MVFPHGGAGVLRLWCQVVKDLSMVRARLGALLLIAQSSAHSAARRWAKEYRVESVVNQLGLTTNSLRWPRNDAAVSAEGALSTRAFVSWLRRHGKERFGAKPGSAVCGEAAPEYELLVPH